MGAFCAVSLRGVSEFRASAMIYGCIGRDVCTDCLENVRWQNGHSREVSTLIDVIITSMVAKRQLGWWYNTTMLVAERHNSYEQQLCGGNRKIVFKVTEACSVDHSTQTTKT